MWKVEEIARDILWGATILGKAKCSALLVCEVRMQLHAARAHHMC